MEREQALEKLNALVGKDLRPLAAQYTVTVFTPSGNRNKGWAGHVIERYLGLPLNSSRAPNFGSWELKVVPFKLTRAGALVPKETMAITMLDPVEVAQKPFEESHLYMKLKKQIVVARTWVDQSESVSLVHKVATFDLGDGELYGAIKQDYELVRKQIKTSGFLSLSGKLGRYVQPRTKGPGGNAPKTRAFYARTQLVSLIFAEPVIEVPGSGLE